MLTLEAFKYQQSPQLWALFQSDEIVNDNGEKEITRHLITLLEEDLANYELIGYATDSKELPIIKNKTII